MFFGKKKPVEDKPDYEDEVVRILTEAQVHVARWYEDRPYLVVWDDKPYHGWVLLHSWEPQELLNFEGITKKQYDFNEIQFLKCLRGAASWGLLEKPLPLAEAWNLKDAKANKEWQKSLPYYGPTRQYRWTGSTFEKRDDRPEWARRKRGQAPELPLDVD